MPEVTKVTVCCLNDETVTFCKSIVRHRKTGVIGAALVVKVKPVSFCECLFLFSKLSYNL